MGVLNQYTLRHLRLILWRVTIGRLHVCMKDGIMGLYVYTGDTMMYRTCKYDSKLITVASEEGRLRCQCASHADVHVDISSDYLRSLSRTCSFKYINNTKQTLDTPSI